MDATDETPTTRRFPRSAREVFGRSIDHFDRDPNASLTWGAAIMAAILTAMLVWSIW